MSDPARQPLVDAVPWLETPERIRSFADEQGYVFARDLVPRRAVAAARKVALSEGTRAGWLTGETTADGQAMARRGAKLTGIGYDDPSFVRYQQALLPHPDIERLARGRKLATMLEAILGAPPLAFGGNVLTVKSLNCTFFDEPSTWCGMSA